MSKHTPGPWSYWSGYNPFDKIEAQVTAEDGDIVIASYNHLIEEGEANARLMAAAPDLLEALEALERIKDIWLPDVAEDQHQEEMIVLHNARTIMLAAIAKAKGK